jgi:hypothetical protein
MAPAKIIKISEPTAGGNEAISVRIEAKRGRQILARIHLPLEQFAEALMGKGAVVASFTTTGEEP